MADATKYHQINGGSMKTDLAHPFSVLKTKKTVAFAYGFTLAFVVSTVFLASSPSTNASSPWFVNLFSTSTAANTTAQPSKVSGSQFPSVFSYFFPKTPSSSQFPNLGSSVHPPTLRANSSGSSNVTARPPSLSQETSNSTTLLNQTETYGNKVLPSSNQNGKTIQKPLMTPNQTAEGLPVESSSSLNNATSVVDNATKNTGMSSEAKALKANQTTNPVPTATAPKASSKANPFTNISSANHSSDSLVKPDSWNTSNSEKGDKGISLNGISSNYTASLSKKQNNGATVGVSVYKKKDDFVESLMNCDLFDGEWVKDDSYPLYEPGSCPITDEQFSCIFNGRPDKDYQKYKWKPKKCNLPRLDASHMLEMLRGKRLVFVGDSLNRNMWESLICILRNSVDDKSKVYEVNGRQHFRGEASYSFIFQDYNCSIELYVSPFLVQEWETQDKNGSKKETLRLDLVGRTSDEYKGADIIIFNTGHWWTHEKTSLGKDYYQEGSHIYGELNVLEAFRKALTTWGRWVDANINPLKSTVLFRGYSDSHFSGGQWNSGGQCDSETAPIKNETYLREYPPKMAVLEGVLKGMKTHVSYMNITRMTDFRKDGHPSIYGKRNMTEEERRSPLHYQDCSHWCLPGVPDAWNEILYTELLVRQKLKQRPLQNP